MIHGSYAFAGAATGFVIGLTGAGGGALMTPILLLAFGVAPTTAVATDLWFAAVTKMIGARVHHAGGNVDWQVVRRLWWGSLPAAIAVVAIVGAGIAIAKVHWLTQAIGGVVLVTAAGMLASPHLLAAARNRRIGNPARFKAAQPGLTVASGAALGLAVALTSIGAGALGSVLLLYLYPLRMTPHRLVATDLVHAIPLAVVAGIGYLFAGMVNWSMLFSLLLGSVPAVLAGSALARRVSGNWMRVALALTLAATGIGVLS